MGDIRTTTGEQPPKTNSERLNGMHRSFFIGMIIFAGVIAIGFIIKAPRRVPASGYATTERYAEVRSAVSGRVKEILVYSGDKVEKGAPLVLLEDSAEQSAVNEAEGFVEKGKAELALREAKKKDELQRHKNSIAAAEMDLAHAKDRLTATEQLHAKGLASGRQLSEDKFSVEKTAELLRALNEVDMTIADREIEVLKREIETRKDSLAGMRSDLEQRTIRAQIDGRAAKYTFYAGEMIRPDVVLYEIFDGDVNVLKLRIPERYAGEVEKGMELDVKLGTVKTLLPTRFKGKVSELRDVVEGDGDNNYRVAYCTFDSENESVPPGTSAEARICIGRSTLWSLLFRP